MKKNLFDKPLDDLTPSDANEISKILQDSLRYHRDTNDKQKWIECFSLYLWYYNEFKTRGLLS